ncbi:MAG: hypothetical protein LQ344_000076 [Seirophora lacunosa]|nr:MAG: hypothetical protein LQ344_000076 [Seirophora lacunosa]
MAGMKLGGSSAGRSGNVISLFDSKRSTTKDSQRAPSDNDGFTTVSRAKPPVERPKLRNIDGNRNGVPSAAAQSRRDHYEPATKKDSHYKQDCIPKAERDPAREAIEACKGKILHKSQFKPGMLIRGWLHEQDYSATSTGSNLTVMDPCRSDTRFGTVCSKYRKMIVLALFEDHYLAIPMFTHNGNGLEFKTNTNEFISVHDHRYKGEHVKQNGHKPLVTEVINRGIDLYDLKCTAHVTYALSRRYDLEIVLEGALTKPSTNRLIELYHKFAPKHLKDPNGRAY